jgi:alanyl-tRNA synthetase
MTAISQTPPRTANELRRAFTDFFTSRGHAEVASGSLIPHDPGLLFTVAGMVPFKPYFVGDETPPYKRAVTVQKCVRAGGKHNDLDDVGRTARHLVFFEMLGNFSFGDYFKTDAIPFAWEFVTKVLGLDPERLWVTVHLSDDEAEVIWRDTVGVPQERIQRLDEDNFWRMGDTGPCGPCSEIFWDKGPDYGHDGGPAHGAEERFVEIWNLVFMQFNQSAEGMTPLPKPSIDTGAGLERILGVLQDQDSVWEIDAFKPLIDRGRELTGVDYVVGNFTDGPSFSLRVLAEHARSSTMLVGDGVFPSNDGRGYVLRRIIRRAVRHAYLLGAMNLVMPELVKVAIDVMGDAYPNLRTNADFIVNLMTREEERFRQTLASGLAVLDDELAKLPSGGPLPGTVAFLLHDTHGFPVELTEEIVAERGFSIDRDGFDEEMAQQRKRAKDARKGSAITPERMDAYREISEQFGLTEFVGYTDDTATSQIVATLPNDDGTVEVFVSVTPFYAESGGQIGDTGTITTDTGVLAVIDTTNAIPGLRRHTARAVSGSVTAGQSALMSIDVERRTAIRKNHTATHLLHAALRTVLGEHVKQAGSLVGPDRLRFDFNHFSAVSADEIAEIERLVNNETLANAATDISEMPKADAEALGAIAFFGDKYGDTVRVMRAGPTSIELCGGTHVSALGDIGLVKIVAEGSIGSNVRRIEAVTGRGSLALLQRDEATISHLAATLAVTPDALADGVDRRLAEIDQLRAEIKMLKAKQAAGAAGDMAATAVDGVVVARVDDISPPELKDLAVAIRQRPGIRAAVLIGAPAAGGVAVVSAVTPESGFVASDLIAAAAKVVQGGGGKSADIATAGGKNPAGIDEAIGLIRAAAGLA